LKGTRIWNPQSLTEQGSVHQDPQDHGDGTALRRGGETTASDFTKAKDRSGRKKVRHPQRQLTLVLQDNAAGRETDDFTGPHPAWVKVSRRRCGELGAPSVQSSRRSATDGWQIQHHEVKRGHSQNTDQDGTSGLRTTLTAGTVGGHWELKIHSPRPGRQDHDLLCFGYGSTATSRPSDNVLGRRNTTRTVMARTELQRLLPPVGVARRRSASSKGYLTVLPVPPCLEAPSVTYTIGTVRDPPLARFRLRRPAEEKDYLFVASD
ncbi:hypothetical protein A4X13_0g5253, partial [Tilletia indica]